MDILESNTYKFLKENLVIIVIIPTILGGVWQLFELARISTSFIRFFSVTQLVPDGMLICFFIFLIFCGYLLVFGNTKSFQRIISFDDIKSVTKASGVFYGIMLSVSIACLCGFYPDINKLYNG